MPPNLMQASSRTRVRPPYLPAHPPGVVALKRAMDVIGGGILLVLALPVFASVSMALGTSGQHVFSRHRRVGRRGREFFCLKFQTMRPEADVLLHQFLNSNPQARAERQTSRKLRNDPRITLIGRKLMGVAENIIRQIEQRVAYDIEYINNWSIWLDMKIMLLTMVRLHRYHGF